MKTDLITVSGVTGYIDENGTAMLNLENVARGLGFTRIAESGNEVVRWERVEGYLKEFGFMPTSGHDSFIPENIFYRLAFKASNKTAVDFQCKVADEILPAIRKHGAYMTPETIEKVLSDPDTLIRLATELKTEREQRKALETENAQQKQIISELKPKASYYDVVLQTKDVVSIGKIAKDYGKSAQWLNEKLHEFGVQYKQGSVWLLYQKYAEQGYTKSKTHTYSGDDGEQHSALHTYWTQKGRLFIYDLLKTRGILPLIEQQSSQGAA